MKKRWNIVVGGPAGTGPNFLTEVLGKALIKKGYNVFFSRDYQSLIRGGHNFNHLTFSEDEVNSNDSKIDILVCLDEKTEKLHSKNVTKDSIILKGQKENTYYVGALFKLLCLDLKILEGLLKNKSRYEENMKFAKEGYASIEKEICKGNPKPKKVSFVNGSKGISEGAIKSGLDVYFAYPMTPATPVIGMLAEKEKEENIMTIEIENEIAVANAGVGCAMTGAKTMVGTSGGGFDLMAETLSLTGIAEIPLVFYLAQRQGPGTGVATYNSQGDLNIALHNGHGEFNRLVVAPGDPKEAEELTNQAFYFSQKYRTPSIIVSDKHLSECFYSVSDKPKILKVPKPNSLIKYNSYETNSEGVATEDPATIIKNIDIRKKKGLVMEKEMKKFSTYEVYGKKNSKNVVVFWGSTKGAVLDAIEGTGAKAIQIKYMEPFPKEVAKMLKGNIILVENDSTGQLADLIRKKTGVEVNTKILRYDGRPFFADELKDEILKRLKK